MGKVVGKGWIYWIMDYVASIETKFEAWITH